MSSRGVMHWQSGSDNDEEVMLDEVHGDNDRSQLLNYEVENRPRSRFGNRERQQRGSVSERQREERKYKYSLVSVLVIGICLLLTVSIGLGSKRCEDQSSSSHNSHKIKPTVKVCLDNATQQTFPWQNYRLPTSVFPLEYHIFLHPNFTTQKCSGEITMSIAVNKETNYVIMHRAASIKIDEVSISRLQSPNAALKISQTLYCAQNQMLALKLESALKMGQDYRLKINFSYDLTFSLEGFYLSRYKKSNGEEMVIGTTQMEPTAARNAFPCFDEPAFKANVSFTMVREKKYKTLFNMPLMSSKPYLNGKLEVDKFQSSPRMSSYLIAFVVSDFERITGQTTSGVEVSVYASEDKIPQSDFALSTAIKVLDFYENFFKIPFPLPKMDLVAIPDFEAGAMENWGLILYRETAILYDPLTSSVADQEWVAIVIAHEIAHQWFGNLVTMEWWNDLWLNEGFASYMEYFGSNGIYPKWKMMEQYPLAHEYRAMRTDVSRFTHPISVPVTNSAEIKEIFDDISYSKGGNLISMLKDFFGKYFFEGVNSYLRNYAYGNANNTDLIKFVAIAAKAHSKVDIQAMMDTWTTEPGFPVVSISRSENGKVTAKQRRFLYSTRAKESPSLYDTTWQVPLSYVTDTAPNTTEHFLLIGKSDNIPVNFKSWIKVNHDVAGYYLVTYDKELWKSLSTLLNTNPTVLTANDRMGLIADAFAAAHTGQLSYANAFNMLKFIKKETDYVVFVKAISTLNGIKNVLKFQLDEVTHKKVKKFASHLLQPMYDRVAWKNSNNLPRQQAKLQSEITTTMCYYDHEPCVKHALTQYAEWLKNNSKVSPDYLQSIFEAAVMNGPAENWDYLWSFYSNSSDATLKRKIMSALTSTRSVDKMLFLQNQILVSKVIRSQDTSLVISGLSTSLTGATLTWRFVRQYWDEVTKLNPVSGFSMRRILKTCLLTLSDESDIVAAESFLKAKGMGEMKFIKQALEAARINLFWVENHLIQVKNWLHANEKFWN